MNQNKIQGQQNSINNQQNNTVNNNISMKPNNVQVQQNGVNPQQNGAAPIPKVVPVQQYNAEMQQKAIKQQNQQAQQAQISVQQNVPQQQPQVQQPQQPQVQPPQVQAQNQQPPAQQIRKISPEEVQLARLTQEELQKTQVLNLKDVEETVRFEKITSKKPAIVVAVMGIILLSFGTTVQIAKTLSANKVEENVVEKREIKDDDLKNNKVEVESLNCILTALNNADGTDTIFNINYQFNNNVIQGFTKTFNITATVGNAQGPVTVQSYTTAYQSFLNEVEGYKIAVNPIANGLATNVEVDYTKLDLALLPPKQQEHFSTSVDYQPNTTKEAIQADMIQKGYTCQ